MSEALPEISFATDVDTGIFRPAADILGVSTGATERLRCDATATRAAGNLYVGGTPASPRRFYANGDAEFGIGFFTEWALSAGAGQTAGNVVISTNGFADEIHYNVPTGGLHSVRVQGAAYLQVSDTEVRTGSRLIVENHVVDELGARVTCFDAYTDNLAAGLLLEHQTSGVPAPGIGVFLGFAAQTLTVGDGVAIAGIAGMATDVTAGAAGGILYGVAVSPADGDDLGAAFMAGNISALSPAGFGVGVDPVDHLTIKKHTAFTGSWSCLRTGAVQTTDATTTTATAVTLDDTKVYWLEAEVTARETDGSDHATWKVWVQAHREGAGAAVSTVQNLATPILSAGALLWTATFTASGNDVRVSVTGGAGQTVNWCCTVRYQGVSGSA